LLEKEDTAKGNVYGALSIPASLRKISENGAQTRTRPQNNYQSENGGIKFNISPKPCNGTFHVIMDEWAGSLLRVLAQSSAGSRNGVQIQGHFPLPE